MIEFETETLKNWRKRALNPNVIGECTLTEGTLVISYNCDIEGERGDTLFAETTKPSLEEIWGQINGKPKSKIISFEIINDDSDFKGSKIHLEVDSINSFIRVKDTSLLIMFYDDREALPLTEGDTKESLDDIYRQLCEVKGITETEVKEQ